MVTEIPVFPLGAVLFPHMPLALRVFEERYLVMLSRILPDEPSEFGVVLIERGEEVGGGERRLPVGTIAQIEQLDATEEFVVLVATGARRFEVVEWLEEDPHPAARIRELPALVWTKDLLSLRGTADAAVRRTLRVASEFADPVWSPDVELSDEPAEAVWQLAAIAPLGPLDQMTLLRSASTESLLTTLVGMMATTEESLRARWTED